MLDTGTAGRPPVLLLLLLLCLAWPVGVATAQLELQGEAGIHPELDGQWAGPYHLGAFINPGQDAEALEWRELAHMCLLPPTDPPGSGPGNAGRLLLWGLRGTAETSEPTFLWDVDAPTTATTIYLPNPVDGSQDIFCSGHTFLADGQLLVVGGTDMQHHSPELHAGTRAAHLFDNELTPGWSLASDSMQFRRWYPSVIRLADGSVLVAGGSNQYDQPDGTRPDLTRDQPTISAGKVSWDHRDNYSVDECVVQPALYSLDDFAHLHQLATTGEVFRADGPSSLLRFGVCAVGPDVDRFDRTLAGPVPKRRNNSVHFVYPQAGLTTGNGVHDVIFAIGGDDDVNCIVSTLGSSQVLKSIDPVPGAPWDDLGADDLLRPRVNSCSVVLLDGSILTIGGQSSTTGDCTPQRHAEAYRPEEIFGEPAPRWRLMAQQAVPRTYHSSAVLLPDGRVVSGGGKGVGHQGQVDAYPTLEVFSPPYVFQPTQRPVLLRIDNIAFQDEVYPRAVDYDERIGVDAHLGGDGGGQFRVALLSPGSSTHGVDFNQRYIVLRTTSFIQRGDQTQIDVMTPTNTTVAPPGWYLMTVVDSTGLPSVARWIRLGP